MSVVLPAHNASSTIVQSIHSALKQRSVHAEVVVCDDASSDDTVSAIAQTRSPKVRLLRNAKNIGPGLSRDRAIDAARGEWIAFLDADDAFSPNRLELMLKAAAVTNADVVFDDLMLCHDTARGMSPWRRLHGLCAFGSTGHPSVVKIEDYIRSNRLLIKPVTRTAFIRIHRIHHSPRRFGEDAEFVLRLAHAGARFCYVPTAMYLYRISPSSLTAQARDPTLMRHRIEECSRWDGWWLSAREAFTAKIASLRRNEAMYALSSLVLQGRAVDALRLLHAEPHLLGAIPHKALAQLRYHAHRLMHGGRKR